MEKKILSLTPGPLAPARASLRNVALIILVVLVVYCEVDNQFRLSFRVFLKLYHLKQCSVEVSKSHPLFRLTIRMPEKKDKYS